MNGALRAVLVALVFLDLMFVKITEAARPEWLVPLIVLTFASPLLLAYRRRIVYRLVWNGAIVGVFVLLVHHATSGGVQYLLEDGLLLAALCQVHLLNNIGPDQKPDLLFFNSFLIPVVTCFLSGDLAYLILFLVYAPLLVLGLQLYILSNQGRSWSRSLMFRVARDAAVRSAIVVSITLAVFYVFPRDFHRRGLVGDRITLRPIGLLNPGYTEEVDLEKTGVRGGSGDPIVMQVRVVEGPATDVPTYWRGSSFVLFDGSQWHVGRPSDFPRGNPANGTQVYVDLKDTRSGRMFSPLSAARIHTGNRALDRQIQPMRNGAPLLPAMTRLSKGFRYYVHLAKRLPRRGGTRPWPTNMSELQVPVLPRELLANAAAIRAKISPAAPQQEVVEAIRSWLENEYEYLPPGESGAAESLSEFASGEAGGHCEFFATALVVMLRSQGIPARFVAGYRSVEWDAEGKILTIRDRHAHAWTEVKDPVGGWYPVDATPPAVLLPVEGEGLFSAVGQFFQGMWDSMKGFDAKARAKALQFLAALPERFVRYVVTNPWSAVIVAALLAALILVRRLSRPLPAPVRDYLRTVRRAGLAVRRGETPRELLDRANLLALPPKKLRRLATATAAHEAARYRRR